ncbi:succinate dehydrogenase, hydrophobic membrane anchor protein [Alphaproteobacteria bacterium]|jgi:succinate dehydrogenase / fumarate reductase membrane anchor subunit|nr:succinate dehydrogenase, hydrophobic membrane anchor protein [Alphaproteobacteria bacterium]MDB9872261.1 succinate dehydrogenase, hydrophobic membrane anchor protein [Alphaproteobacteria bacterium]|tara:strand:+ start:4354 stop:4734 length:381 start_codon:yes stop_codon:yes gene_type:complete
MNNTMKSDLAKVQGLGSAKHGVGHWKLQRVSAIGMIPLILWFIPSLMLTIISGYNEAILWIQNPFNATGLILLLGTIFFHASLGLQVVIEDYVHSEGLKIISITFIKLLSILLGVLSILCVLKIFL